MTRMLRAAAITLVMAFAVYGQTEVTLEPAADNTLYEDANGNLSNGSGDYLFAGSTASGAIRRALVRFDVAGAIPANATILSAELTMHISREAGPALPISLHRALADWGEGASNAGGEEGAGAPPETGDATWIHTFFDTDFWSTAGGDFESTASATATSNGLDDMTWGSGGELAADVQGWLDSPADNFGWVVIGDESQASTAKRFDSRENGTEAVRPRLRITWSPSTAIDPDADRSALARGIRLIGNYPNPFNPSTTIAFELAARQSVRLTVYDAGGREVATLIDGVRQAGRNEVRFEAGTLPTGTYLYRLSAGGAQASGTMLLVK